MFPAALACLLLLWLPYSLLLLHGHFPHITIMLAALACLLLVRLPYILLLLMQIIILVVTLPSSPHSHKYIICTQTRTHTQTHTHTRTHSHAHLTQSHCTAVPRWVQTVLSVFQFPRHTTAVTVVPAESQATLAVCLRTCVKGCLTARVKWGSVVLPSLRM